MHDVRTLGSKNPAQLTKSPTPSTFHGLLRSGARCLRPGDNHRSGNLRRAAVNDHVEQIALHDLHAQPAVINAWATDVPPYRSGADIAARLEPRNLAPAKRFP